MKIYQKISFFAAMVLLIAAIVIGPTALIGQGFSLVSSVWESGALNFRRSSDNLTLLTIHPTGGVTVKTYLRITSIPTAAGPAGSLWSDGGTLKITPE